MNPPNIITGTCETCGQLEHVEGTLLVCKYCQVEVLTAENKRLRNSLEGVLKHEMSLALDEGHVGTIARCEEALKPTNQKEANK